MGHINPNPLPECAGYRVGGVDPAVRVQHVLGDVFRVDTVYGVADILAGGHYQGEGQEEGHCGSVVESEYAGVDGDVVRLHQTLQSSEYLQHCPQQSLIPSHSLKAPSLSSVPCCAGAGLADTGYNLLGNLTTSAAMEHFSALFLNVFHFLSDCKI